MARILIAWEFGGGMGHVTQLVSVAEALGRRGHRLAFELHDLRAAGALGLSQRLASIDCTIRQGPHWNVVRGGEAARAPKQSLADALKVYDYHNTERLLAVARSWQQRLDQFRPDLVLGDFCPTLRLVAADRYPMVVIGTGYTVPPPGRPLPPVVPWQSRLPPASVESEAEIYRAVCAVTRSLGLPAIGHVSDLFSGTKTFVCTIPEFDPYRAYRNERTFDLFNLPVFDAVRPVEQRPENRVFLYMPNHHPAMASILSAVKTLGIGGSAYIVDPPEELRARFSESGLSMFDKPPSLAHTLPEARLLIHHGGLSTTYSAVVSGTPQMIMPRFLEHSVTARGAFDLGSAAVLLGAEATNEATVSGILRWLLQDRPLWLRAEAAARRMAGRRQSDPLASILTTCHDLLEG